MLASSHQVSTSTANFSEKLIKASFTQTWACLLYSRLVIYYKILRIPASWHVEGKSSFSCFLELSLFIRWQQFAGFRRDLNTESIRLVRKFNFSFEKKNQIMKSALHFKKNLGNANRWRMRSLDEKQIHHKPSYCLLWRSRS